jgi:dienelactone hydrolase
MGLVVLIACAVTEVAFLIFCVVTRSPQREIRNYIRLGALGAFVLCTLLSVIRWSFRWYALALLLLVWGALGAWALLGRRPGRRQYSAGRTTLRAIATVLLVFLSITPALVLPQYRPPRVTGEHPVATVSYTYSDQTRAETFSRTGGTRKVNVQFWYPEDSSRRYPLVVFSHGAFGLQISNTSTFMELASNGYVVCSLDHPNHSLFTRGADGHVVRVDRAFLQEIIGVNNGTYDDAEILTLEKKWMSLRTQDISFALDTILAHARAAGSGAPYQCIDTASIGLMGHSLGGAASAEVGRERCDIKAVIDLDGDLLGEYLAYVDGKRVLNDEPYPVPILIIYADDMVDLINAVKDPNDVVAVKHVAAAAKRAYEVHIAGTNHMSLTDLPLVSPLLVRVISVSVPRSGRPVKDAYGPIEKMNSTVLSFFNVFLKGEGSFTPAGTPQRSDDSARDRGKGQAVFEVGFVSRGRCRAVIRSAS